MKDFRRPNFIGEITKAIGLEFLNLMFGNIYTKVGFSLLLFLLGLVFIFAKVQNEMIKPNALYIIGYLLIIISIIIIGKRCLELKSEMENKK